MVRSPEERWRLADARLPPAYAGASSDVSVPNMSPAGSTRDHIKRIRSRRVSQRSA